MAPESGANRRLFRLAHWAAWMSGGFVVSAVLANVCIMAGAILALAFESGAGRTLGVVINGAALALMIALYAGSLWGFASLLGSRWKIPTAAWVGLALFPAVWLVIVAIAPAGAVAVTPTVVPALGTVLTWIAIRRIHAPSDAHQRESALG